MNEIEKRIAAYFDNEMSSSELGRFEEDLQTDVQLAEAFQLEKDIRLAFDEDAWFTDTKNDYDLNTFEEIKAFLSGEEANTLREKIAELSAETESKKRGVPWRFIAIAAMLIGFVSSVYFLVFQKPPSFGTLYEQNIALNQLPSLLSRAENDALLVKGQAAFESGDYQKAITYFSDYEKNNSVALPYSQIYLGIAYLELDQFDKALQIFDTLATSDSTDREHAPWYIALTHLKQGDSHKAKEKLKEVIKTGNLHTREAEALLKDLDGR